MDLLMQDVRYGVRRLASSPFFTVMAILIVGVGIAANTTVFSAVNAVLLRPLPFADAGRVVHVYQDLTRGSPSRARSRPIVRSPAGPMCFPGRPRSPFRGDCRNRSRCSSVAGQFATASYFSVLGLRPLNGRWFSGEEDGAGAPATAVVAPTPGGPVSDRIPGVIGRSVRLGR